MKTPRSDIPRGVVEQLVTEDPQHRIVNCLLDGRIVGRRTYCGVGRLVVETPLKDGHKHGREYSWNDDGTLLLAEPNAADAGPSARRGSAPSFGGAEDIR
jgi:hypothetical protein